MGLPIDASESSNTSLSALQTFLTSKVSTVHTAARHKTLALQIAHNLRFQHNWTELRLHEVSSRDGTQPFQLLSGLPPDRLYVHPDEQIELLQQQQKQGKMGMPELIPEREWVVPSYLREKWTLRRFGNTFDAIEVVPMPDSGSAIDLGIEDGLKPPGDAAANKWRMTKRVLLATLDDDSTVVYYIVHDGLQKPRQN